MFSILFNYVTLTTNLLATYIHILEKIDKKTEQFANNQKTGKPNESHRFSV